MFNNIILGVLGYEFPTQSQPLGVAGSEYF